MKCEELLAMLNEYVDGTVDPAVCAEFEQHMAGCNPCQVVVDNIRQTITLYKDGQPYRHAGEIPRADARRLAQKVAGEISGEVIAPQFFRLLGRCNFLPTDNFMNTTNPDGTPDKINLKLWTGRPR